MNTSEQTNGQLGIGFSDRSLTPTIPIGAVATIPINTLYLFMIIDGNGVVAVDNRDINVSKGTFIYMLPQHLLSLRSCSGTFKTAYACFTFELLSDFPLLLKADISEYVGDHPYCELTDADYNLLLKYHDLLADRYRAENAGMEIIKGILYSFVMEINRIYTGRIEEVQSTHQDKLSDAFFKLLHSHFTKEHSAAFYANKLCVSDKHLMRVIKKKTGQTFHFWLTDFLLRRAKLLLLSSDMNVIQITENLNFPDSSAFAKFFRKGTGLSPTTYRKQHSKPIN